MIKLLIGGSPCTFWSIAQSASKREKKAEGQGWELFKNYLIAKKKFKPDFFLYENNCSASAEIKEQIKTELGVWDGTFLMADTGSRYIEIDSALVSAQHRQRFYVHNCGEVEQPKDRGILLQDILENGEDLTSNAKSYCLTASYGSCVAWNTIERNQRTMIANPIRIGTLPNAKGEMNDAQATRIYSTSGKSVNLVANGGGGGAKTGLYAVPVNTTQGGKPQTLKAQYHKNSVSNFVKYHSTYGATGVAEQTTAKSEAYGVKDGQITIKGKQYPIKLQDGFYTIRKLTVTECCRLQTLPDDYCRAVSATQGYKGLGNGWTAEVIVHILNGALKDVPRDEEIVALSMYDGIGTGRYCLDKMGFTNVKYYAYEIDKYAIQIAMSNYPDIIQMGDAFQVRDDNWQILRR